MCLLTLASAVLTLTLYHSSSHEVWKFTPMKYLKFCITVSFWLCLISSEVSFGLYRQVVGINFVLAYNREAFGHLFSHESHVSLKKKHCLERLCTWNWWLKATMTIFSPNMLQYYPSYQQLQWSMTHYKQEGWHWCKCFNAASYMIADSQ